MTYVASPTDKRMTICHAHNLNDRDGAAARPYGIRVSLPPGDTFRLVLGDDWSTEHWFPDKASRDRAMADMAHRHRYSRIGDDPRIRLEAIER